MIETFTFLNLKFDTWYEFSDFFILFSYGNNV